MYARRQRRIRRRPGLRWQKGQVILLSVVLLAIVGAIALFSVIQPRNPALGNNAQTAQALAQAKQALIAYAGARYNERPGELPCPDTDNNGSAQASCNTAASQIGRLPWSTLGLPDLRDSAGERLWYAVSSNFKNNPALTPLNSNTPGQLGVTGIAPASNVIAIVFAAGAAVAGQTRSTANVNNVAHYLEGENANGDTTFTTAVSSDTFNDRLLAINAAMFFPQVELRVAREARVFLNEYYRSRDYFPSANAYGGSACTAAAQGRIAEDPSACTGGQHNWVGAGVPNWFWNEKWHEVLFYAVAPACADPAATLCAGAGGYLSVNGVGNVRALVITPGAVFPGQVRSLTAGIGNYLEPPNTTAFPAFTHAAGSATLNDRVIIVAP